MLPTYCIVFLQLLRLRKLPVKYTTSFHPISHQLLSRHFYLYLCKDPSQSTLYSKASLPSYAMGSHGEPMDFVMWDTSKNTLGEHAMRGNYAAELVLELLTSVLLTAHKLHYIGARASPCLTADTTLQVSQTRTHAFHIPICIFATS